jgi:hypothetical protein
MIFEKNGATVTISTVFDALANDSNKSWVVPAGEVWKLNWGHILYVASADAGNRQMEMVVLDDLGQEVYNIFAGGIQGASTTRHYNFAQGVYRETAFTALEIQVPTPIDLYMPAGFTLKFFDSSAIAAAADDMTVAFQVEVSKPRFIA